VAHVTSTDLVTWSVGAPVVGPGDFGQIEIPQSIRLGQRWHLIYSIAASVVAPHRASITGSYQVVAEDLAGPYHEPSDPVVIEHPDWYGAKIVTTADGLKCLAWRNFLPDGTFAGEIGDPWPVDVTSDGSLRVHGP
jgi:hypothetical protein